MLADSPVCVALEQPALHAIDLASARDAVEPRESLAEISFQEPVLDRSLPLRPDQHEHQPERLRGNPLGNLQSEAPAARMQLRLDREEQAPNLEGQPDVVPVRYGRKLTLDVKRLSGPLISTGMEDAAVDIGLAVEMALPDRGREEECRNGADDE